MASYTTLSLGQQIWVVTGWRWWLWLLGGGLALGTGIWATHFVAMLALEMPMPVAYDLLTTVLSLLYAAAAAAVALALVSQPGFSWLRLSAGGGVMGAAIAWMHYTGMAAMEMPAHLSYRWPLVALSVAIAVGASTLALGFALGRSSTADQPWPASGAVLALGAAIGGLHYVGMVGTVVQPDSAVTDALGAGSLVASWLGASSPLTETVAAMPDLDTRWLALAVGLGAGVLLLLTLITLRIAQRLTQQRLQDDALAHSERRFRMLIREMGVGVLLLNAEAEILISNQAAQQLLGLPDDGPTPLLFGQSGYICGEDGVALAASELPVQRAIAAKRPLDDGVIGVSASAADPPRWLLVNVDPQLSAAGVVERVVCTCSDITIQKAAEGAARAVANREKAVMRIVQRMRQTLDLEEIFAATTQELQQAVGCDRVWIYRFNADWSGTVVAETLTDSTASSTLATTAPDQPLIDRDDCGARRMQSAGFDDGYLLVEDTYLKETQAETYRQDRTYHCVNDIYTEGFDTCYLNFLEQWQVRAYVIVPIFSGSRLWGLLGIYAHHRPRVWNRHEVKMVLQVGAHLGTAVQQSNLLWQTQLQAQALEVAKRAADAASQAKGDFLASMSHELRTPLNAILGFTQILYDDDSLEASHRDLIAIVNRSGNHLLGLINNVLSLAKIEANKITLDEGAFDFNQTLQAVEAMLQLKAETKGIGLEVLPLASTSHRLWADEGKLRQILINLIGNAIKFTSQGQVTVRASLTAPSAQESSAASSKTHRLVLEVQDTGVGIDPAEQSRLFQPFEQTQAGRQTAEGTGLGLSLCHNFAQLMGGTLAVASTPGAGSTFTVNLPVALAAASPALGSQPRAILRLSDHQPTHRILVADDVAESRLLMRHWLEGVGFEVCEAANGQAALDLWVAWQPHLICLDMRMPVLDGYDVARQVRQSPGGAATVIIAVTASVFEEQRSDCIAAGCNEVLPKPLQRDRLLEPIGRRLGLTYQYAEQPEATDQLLPAASPSPAGPHRSLTQADLLALDPARLADLHQAAQAADDRRVRQMLAQFPADHQHLAQQLAQLVDDFRLDVIIELTAVPLSSVSL
ncbi:MAG TPA: MHYT domain-containing protein [Nodosilinea sp.]|nr:MHYT domain-containing protein [Nodosilinea sp.]